MTSSLACRKATADEREVAAAVEGRLVVVVGWIAWRRSGRDPAGSVDAQSGALAQLVPDDSRALEAEELSAATIRFPLSSRTVIVERDPQGLSPAGIADTAQALQDVNRNLIEHVHAEGAYGITNAVPGCRSRASAAPRPSATCSTSPSSARRCGSAGREAYIRALDAPPAEFVGVTGAIPARAEQADLISGAAAADRARHRRASSP